MKKVGEMPDEMIQHISSMALCFDIAVAMRTDEWLE